MAEGCRTGPPAHGAYAKVDHIPSQGLRIWLQIIIYLTYEAGEFTMLIRRMRLAYSANTLDAPYFRPKHKSLETLPHPCWNSKNNHSTLFFAEVAYF